MCTKCVWNSVPSEWEASQMPNWSVSNEQVAFLSYLPGERREEGSSLISFFFWFLWVHFHLIYIHRPLSDVAHKPHKTLDDAVQHCHQHQHHCIQRLRLRWLTWKKNGKKHVWNMKACLRNLTSGISETPLKPGVFGERLGISQLYSWWVQRVHLVMFWLFEWLELSCRFILNSTLHHCKMQFFWKASKSPELI